jgi:hypothetical protein
MTQTGHSVSRYLIVGAAATSVSGKVMPIALVDLSC